MTSTNSPKRIAFVVNAKTGEELRAGNSDSSNMYALLRDPLLGACDPESPPPIHGCASAVDLLTKLKAALENWKPNNQFIFYFSGHGRIYHDVYCLQIGTGQSNKLAFSSVLAELQIAGVSKAIIILDACFSGAALGKKNITQEDPIKAHIQSLPKGLVLIASSRAIEESAELPDGSASVFTHLFCTGIRTGLRGTKTNDGLITAEEICTFINDELSKNPQLAMFSQRPAFAVNGADRRIWVAKNPSYHSEETLDLQPVGTSKGGVPKHVVSPEELEFLYKTTARNRLPCELAEVEDLDWQLVEEYELS